METSPQLAFNCNKGLHKLFLNAETTHFKRFSFSKPFTACLIKPLLYSALPVIVTLKVKQLQLINRLLASTITS